MHNIFDIWNSLKKQIDKKKKYPYFKQGEIRWIQIGKNIKSEVFGKGDRFQRPGIILQEVYGNSAIIIPLTSQEREGSYYFKFIDSKNRKQYALLSQMKYIDGSRVMGKISSITPKDLQLLTKKLIPLLTKNIPPR